MNNVCGKVKQLVTYFDRSYSDVITFTGLICVNQ